VYDRGALGAGDMVRGPAIIEQPDSTVVVAPGWTGCFGASAEIVLTRAA
jgi:N-methylhydantoinase A